MSGLVNPEPTEPGEIGWPANAKAPVDPSIPTPGSGGATAHVPEPSDPPTIEVTEEPEKKSRRK